MRKILSVLALSAGVMFAQEIYAIFDVKPIKEAALSFTAGGTVEKVHADVTDRVKKGEVLAVLDNSEQFATLKLAQNDLRTAVLQEQKAQKSLERFEKVKELIDEEQYDNVSFNAKLMQVAVQKAKRNVELRQAQYEKTILKAPFNGVITARYKEVGDAVSGAQIQNFFHIMDTSKVKLEIAFDEKYANKVKPGDAFIYTLDDTVHTVSIEKIHPTTNTKTRKIIAEAFTKGIMPGRFGNGVIKAK